ncbi:MAG: (S)-ureidoglycine aminohydrolase [Acidobacteria bacterium]|nr:(S)-ureidoglycine aminohydrolase [Acidobacteriota bacterium]
MHNLGHTRSARRTDHYLLTPDTFVRTPMPGMTNATAVVHASPAGGAKFTQYTAELEAGGAFGPTSAQRFIYVLEGVLTAGECTLGPNAYLYIPAGTALEIRAATKARAAVIEKPFQPLAGVAAPEILSGDETSVASVALGGDETLQVRQLIPEGPRFDFAVNTMIYEPGAALSMVEIHVMEHGLLMLEGGGIYRLGDCWYPVTAGDFIWMGPYCPQWFGALGKTPAKYLIYKDFNRHPLDPAC